MTTTNHNDDVIRSVWRSFSVL